MFDPQKLKTDQYDPIPDDFLSDRELLEIFEDESLLSEKQRATRKHILELKNKMLDASRLMLKSVQDIKLPAPEDIIINNGKHALSIISSDDHYGKTIEANNNDNIPVFNRQIADARIDYFIDRALERFFRSPHKYDSIVLNLLGDHIEGDGSIYKSQPYELEMMIEEQILAFETKITEKIFKLASAIQEVNGSLKIYCVPGNHGENRKGYFKDPRGTFDYIIFQHMEHIIKLAYDQGLARNISIDYPHQHMLDRTFLNYTLKGWRVHIDHIMPPNFTTAAGAGKIGNTKEVMDGIDLLFTGHYHSEALATIGSTTIIRTPSLGGYDGFANSIRAPLSGAMHPLITTSTQNKIEEYIPIYLDHIK